MTYIPKHAKPKVKKYEITVVESEKGWGRDEWTEQFDTEREARDRIRYYNWSHEGNTVTPDHYIIAVNEVRTVWV